jgi:disulfide oxidoreductase YuzD
MKKLFYQILCVSLLFSCKIQISPIELALNSNNEKILKVKKNISNHDLQIKLTVINNNKGKKKFNDYNYQIVDKNYFYPASTVKLPIAIFAMEKLNESPEINLDTPFKVENDSITTTIRKEIISVFSISSNESNNRLFEFLGQDYINEKLKQKGMRKSKIFHRLSIENSSDTKTKKIIFYPNDSLVVEFPSRNNKNLEKLNLNKLYKGIGHINNKGVLISKPMDFSRRNYLPINELNHLIKLVFFPKKFKNKNKLKLEENQIEFLKKSMSILPKDAGYDREKYFDSYVKFFVYGDKKEINSDKIKIFNKVGSAYGYLTEGAYIKTDNISIILSATMKVNNNHIYNDNVYEYDSIGIPFFAELGREIIRIVQSK